MSKFNSTRNKFPKTFKIISNNINQIDNLIKVTVKFDQNNFIKKIVKIPIFSGRISSEGGMPGMGG